MKKISVIIPIFKGNYYIPNLIRILEKNWETANKVEAVQIEMVLVNDFPAEKVDVQRLKVTNITLVETENKRSSGIHFSRVQGLLYSSGDYIVFLDQDDVLSPVYIREQIAALGDCDAVICNGRNNNQLIYKNTVELDRAVDVKQYKNGYNRILSPGQVLLRRCAIPTEWSTHIMKRNGADDYFLWMLMFCKNCRIKIHDKVLYWHLNTGENTSYSWAEMNSSILEMVMQVKDLSLLTQEEERQIIESVVEPISKGDEEISIEKYQKEKRYKKILELWMVLRDRKIPIRQFFLQKHLEVIAIYGGGILGKHLYYELQESHVQIECFIDWNQKAGLAGLKTIVPGDKIGYVDAIVITPFMEYVEIRRMLRKYYSCEMISIETILYNADCELVSE